MKKIPLLIILVTLSISAGEVHAAAKKEPTSDLKKITTSTKPKRIPAALLKHDGPRGSLNINGLKRRYLLYLPKEYQENQSYPLLIFLHGGKSPPKSNDPLTGFHKAADTHQFLIAHPRGVKRRWNDGRGSDLATADDVAFISTLIDHVVNRYNANPNRVYVTGFSNGAMMAHRLACELSEKIQGIAPVAGGLPENLITSCNPQKNLSVITFHGTHDPAILWTGDTSNGKGMIGGKVLSPLETVDYWANNAECRDRSEVSMKESSLDDRTHVQKIQFSGCTDGVEVVLYKIEGGGHTWPSGTQYLPESMIGITSKDIDATKLIVEHFELN